MRVLKKQIMFFYLGICFFTIHQFSSAVPTDSLTGTSPQTKAKYNVFPIVMYDSDIGLGLGGKAMIKNRFKRQESLDFTIFASSKGEQWYVFQFSLPDGEWRLRKPYLLAWDFCLEWDKLLKSNFFGIGNNSHNNAFQFPREYFKIQFTLSHAFTPVWIGDVEYRFLHYSVYDYDLSWGTLSPDVPGAQANNVGLGILRLRYDSRDSQIHPLQGMRWMVSVSRSTRWFGSQWEFQCYRMEWSIYRELLLGHIIATRCWLQHIDGIAPYPELSKIGGSWTARGYKADRFLDNAMVLTTVEYRFLLVKNLGGVLFADAGRVMPHIRRLTFQHWHTNWGWGLRYYLTNFVVRFDMGISKEGSRIFFNFGQVF